jgi:hypothetical protein
MSEHMDYIEPNFSRKGRKEGKKDKKGNYKTGKYSQKHIRITLGITKIK